MCFLPVLCSSYIVEGICNDNRKYNSIFVVITSVCGHFYPETEAVASINKAIRAGNADETVEELSNPEAQLPIVYQTAANLYQNELFSLQLQGERVSLRL